MNTLRNVSRTALSAGMAWAMGGAANALPEGWKITEFAAPPQGEYPAAISAAANGDVYISSDRNGSIGKNPEFGKIVRATDTDGDGKADEFQAFVPLVNSPRGGHFVGDTLYLIHPPYLSSFRDTNGDGVADEKKTLPQSMMPPGLGSSLSIGDFTDLIEYLVSLKSVGG